MPSRPLDLAISSSKQASFLVSGINHIGLAPRDPVRARWFFEHALQLNCLSEELVQAQKTQTLMFSSSGPEALGHPAAGQRLEILVPSPAGEGPVAKFLEKKGSGIHHVALNVVGLEGLIEHLQKQGVRMIDEVPRPGAHATRIAFVHPDSTGGLLVELVEETANAPS